MMDNLVVVGGVLIAILVVCAYFIIQAEREAYARCSGLGGHMIEKSASGIGVGPSIGSSGGIAVVPTTTTVEFCISDDGRILF